MPRPVPKYRRRSRPVPKGRTRTYTRAHNPAFRWHQGQFPETEAYIRREALRRFWARYHGSQLR